MAHQINPFVKNYEIIEHTADIGIRVKGKDLKSLFENAGLAVFQLSSEKRLPPKNLKQKSLLIRQQADSLGELFINWLNELLSLSSSKGLIFEDIKITQINEGILEAETKAGDIKNYKVNTEIKAATYHDLKIKKINSEWIAEVILDV